MTSLALARPAQPPVLLAAVQSRQRLAVARVALVVLTLVLALALAWVAVRACGPCVRLGVCLQQHPKGHRWRW
jgi:hypothetical protein